MVDVAECLSSFKVPQSVAVLTAARLKLTNWDKPAGACIRHDTNYQYGVVADKTPHKPEGIQWNDVCDI